MRPVPVCRVYDDDAIEVALPTSGYLTMLGNVSRRAGCVAEVVDDAIIVVMATEFIADESRPVWYRDRRTDWPASSIPPAGATASDLSALSSSLSSLSRYSASTSCASPSSASAPPPSPSSRPRNIGRRRCTGLTRAARGPAFVRSSPALPYSSCFARPSGTLSLYRSTSSRLRRVVVVTSSL